MMQAYCKVKYFKNSENTNHDYNVLPFTFDASCNSLAASSIFIFSAVGFQHLGGVWMQWELLFSRRNAEVFDQAFSHLGLLE
mmetsp:Transcript_27315/g.61669  ORF Transcript_27315/g.61669 Transcript_27315/m.61669 type:complete len:82 (+) Transcript_27315:748-993(+)